MSEIHTLVAITQQNQPRALGYQWEADSTSSHIHLEDILGRRLVLPLALCRNLQTFLDTLKVLYTDHPGYQKVVNREFEVIDQDSGILFDGLKMTGKSQDGFPSPTFDKIRPGARLEMNALIAMKKEPPRNAMIMPVSKNKSCPKCGLSSTGVGLEKW